MLLAIDTATQLISLALHDGKNILAENTWQSSSHHSVELAPAITALLEHGNTHMNAITAIAVCIGPGTYTGLRVGVSLAKGLAAARSVPLIGMTTMDILAAAQGQQATPLITVVKAGRGRIVAADYQWQDHRWQQTTAPQLLEWSALFETITAPVLLTGEIDDDGIKACAAAQENKVPLTLAPAATRLRRAGYLADAAYAQLETHGKAHFAADHVMPVYVKTKDTP